MDIDTAVRTLIAYLALPTGTAGLVVSWYQIKKLRRELDELRKKTDDSSRVIVRVSLDQIEKYGKTGRFWEERRRRTGHRELNGVFFVSFLKILFWLRPASLPEEAEIPAPIALRAKRVETAFILAVVGLWIFVAYLVQGPGAHLAFYSPLIFTVMLGSLVLVYVSSAALLSALDRIPAKAGQGSENDA